MQARSTLTNDWPTSADSQCSMTHRELLISRLSKTIADYGKKLNSLSRQLLIAPCSLLLPPTKISLLSSINVSSVPPTHSHSISYFRPSTLSTGASTLACERRSSVAESINCPLQSRLSSLTISPLRRDVSRSYYFLNCFANCPPPGVAHLSIASIVPHFCDCTLLSYPVLSWPK